MTLHSTRLPPLGVMVFPIASGLFGAGCHGRPPVSTSSADPMCRVDSGLSDVTRRAVQWTVKRNGSSTGIDGNAAGIKDGVCTEEETIHFIYHRPEWRNYLPALDRMGLKHPLDLRDIPPEILERARSLREKIQVSIGGDEKQTGYCEDFVPKFYEAGRPSFRNGGLGFDYPYGTTLTPHELTAGEAFAAVLDPALPYGSCTEATAKVMTAFAAVSSCPVRPVVTQNHMFARFKNLDLDPTGIGDFGWKKDGGEAMVAGMYYVSLVNNARPGSAEQTDYARVAASILPEDSEVLISQTGLAVEQGDLKRAERLALAAIDANPHNPQSFLDYAFILGKLPLEDSIGHAIDFLKRRPRSDLAIWVVIQWAKEKNVFDRLIPPLGEILPDSGHAETLQAFQAFVRNDLRGSKGFLEEALAKNPDHASALFFEASLALDQGLLQEAERLARKSLELAPTLPGNYYLLSVIAMHKGDAETAYREAKKEGLVYFGNPAGLKAIAQAALMAGDLSSAEKYARRYVEERSRDPLSYLTLAPVQFSLGKPEEALKTARQALSFAKALPAVEAQVHVLISTMAFASGDLALAQEHLDQAVRFGAGESLIARRVNVLLLSATGRFQEAVQAADRLVLDFPGFAFAWGAAATVYNRVNQPAKAQEAVDRALRLDRGDSDALIVQIELLLTSGKGREASERMDHFLKKNANQIFLYGPLALEAYNLDGEKIDEMALKIAETVLKSFPNDLSSLYVKGQLKLIQGDVASVRPIAEKLKKLYPNHHFSYMIASGVEFLQGNLEAAEREARRAVEIYPYDHAKIRRNSARWTLFWILKARGKNREAQDIAKEFP